MLDTHGDQAGRVPSGADQPTSSRVPHDFLDRKESRERRESEKRRIESLRRAAEESIKKESAKLAANPPPISVSPDGRRLTTAAIESLGMTDQEVDAIIEGLHAFRNNANNDLVDRTSLVSSVQSEEGNTDTYFVKARVDRGRGLSDALLQSMNNIVGKERASKIISGMEQCDYFGKYGKHDMQIEFTPKSGEVFVKMQYIDPNNGRPTRFRECSLPVFREEFGDIFASSEQE